MFIVLRIFTYIYVYLCNSVYISSNNKTAMGHTVKIHDNCIYKQFTPEPGHVILALNDSDADIWGALINGFKPGDIILSDDKAKQYELLKRHIEFDYEAMGSDYVLSVWEAKLIAPL